MPTTLPPRHRVRCLSRAACASGLALVALVACDDPEIRPYTAPRDAPRPAVTLPDPGGAPAGSIDLHWTVPPDWREVESKQSFTVAAYEAGPTEAPVSITVTRLSGQGGGAVENINRWRGQIGLPPIGELPEQAMDRIDAGDLAAGMVDLVGEAGPTGEPARIVGALLPRPEQNETWFFKMMGPREALEPLKPQLAAMVRSIHSHAVGHGHGHGHEHAHDGAPEATP